MGGGGGLCVACQLDCSFADLTTFTCPLRLLLRKTRNHKNPPTESSSCPPLNRWPFSLWHFVADSLRSHESVCWAVVSEVEGPQSLLSPLGWKPAHAARCSPGRAHGVVMPFYVHSPRCCPWWGTPVTFAQELLNVHLCPRTALGTSRGRKSFP